MAQLAQFVRVDTPSIIIMPVLLVAAEDIHREITAMVWMNFEHNIKKNFSLDCPTNCATCTSSSVCQTCKSGFGLQGTACNTCPGGTWLNGQTCQSNNSGLIFSYNNFL